MIHAFLLTLALTGQSADAVTTCHALHSGTAHEANAFLPNHCGQNVAAKALLVGPMVTWAVLERHRYQTASRIMLVAIGAVGTYAAVHNARLRR